jgi:hypothetical protein
VLLQGQVAQEVCLAAGAALHQADHWDPFTTACSVVVPAGSDDDGCVDRVVPAADRLVDDAQLVFAEAGMTGAEQFPDIPGEPPGRSSLDVGVW